MPLLARPCLKASSGQLAPEGERAGTADAQRCPSACPQAPSLRAPLVLLLDSLGPPPLTGDFHVHKSPGAPHFLPDESEFLAWPSRPPPPPWPSPCSTLLSKPSPAGPCPQHVGPVPLCPAAPWFMRQLSLGMSPLPSASLSSALLSLSSLLFQASIQSVLRVFNLASQGWRP